MKLFWLGAIFALITPTAFAAFPQCKDGKYSTDAQEVRAMIKQVLGVNATTIVEDAPFKGTRKTVSLITSGKTFQFRSTSSVDITAPAKVCQKSDKSLVAVLNSAQAKVPAIAKLAMKSSYTVTITEISPTKVRISEASGLLNNTFSAK